MSSFAWIEDLQATASARPNVHIEKARYLSRTLLKRLLSARIRLFTDNGSYCRQRDRTERYILPRKRERMHIFRKSILPHIKKMHRDALIEAAALNSSPRDHQGLRSLIRVGPRTKIFLQKDACQDVPRLGKEVRVHGCRWGEPQDDRPIANSSRGDNGGLQYLLGANRSQTDRLLSVGASSRASNTRKINMLPSTPI